MDLKNKYVLLTNLYLEKYQGSEINCLSIARLLREKGAIVEIATLKYDFPIKSEFQNFGLNVKNILAEQLDRTHYDLLWAHHSVVLDHLIFKKGITAEKIIFSSLSPFEPLEAPPCYINHLSLCFANSIETKEKILAENVKEDMCLVFPNYVFQEDLRQNYERSNTNIKRIAIVSNHIPGEGKEAVEILRSRGIAVDIYGLGYNVCLITPTLIQEYDAVITIGKTVQYAMGVNVPVYCYDIHGGPGWLCADVLQKAYKYNFSGRGFGEKTGQEIADEIQFEYNHAAAEVPLMHQFCKDNCVLENNLSIALDKLDSAPTVSVEEITKQFATKSRENDAFLRIFCANEKMETEFAKYEKVSQELLNARGHIDQLLQSERDLQADVQRKEGHIAQLLQSERDLQAENNNKMEAIHQLQYNLGYQTSLADNFRQSELELKKQLAEARTLINQLQYELGSKSAP